MLLLLLLLSFPQIFQVLAGVVLVMAHNGSS